MNHNISGAIFATLGLIVAAILLTIGVAAYKSGRDSTGIADSNVEKDVTDMGTHDYVKQDGKTVDGGKVIQYLQQYKDGDVALIVNNGTATQSYVKKFTGNITNGTCTAEQISEYSKDDKENLYSKFENTISGSRSGSTADSKNYVIDPNSSYSVEVIYNKDNGALEAALFNLNAEESGSVNFTMNFYGNGADSGSMSSVKFRTASSISYTLSRSANEYVRKGYKFLGWSTTNDTSGLLPDNYRVTSAFFGSNHTVTVYAIWDRDENYHRTITYVGWKEFPDAKSGEDAAIGVKNDYIATAPTSYYDGDTITMPEPSVPGYEFIGWTAGTSTTPIKELTITSSDTGNKTFTAHWRKNVYTIVFNGNGATSGTMANETMPMNAEAVLSKNTFVRDGYNFMGWSESKYDTTVKYGNEQTIPSALTTAGKQITLYAVWEKDSYTVIFSSNNGNGSMSDTNMKVGRDVTLPTNRFTRDGYQFLGWSESSTATSATYTDGQTVKNLGKPGSTVTLYAVWKAISGQVIYHNDSGVLYTEKVKSGSSFTVIGQKSMTKEHYKFAGWVSAEYEKKAFGITTGTAIVTDAQQYYVNPKTQQTGSYVQIEYTEGRKYTATFTSSDDALNLYPVWVRNDYTVRFNPGTGPDPEKRAYTQSIDVDASVELLPNTFTKSGYKFVGWSGTDSSNTKVVYNDKQTVTNLGSAGTTVNLTAIWSNATYKTAFNANGGFGTMESSTFGEGVETPLPKCTFTKTGYTFAGWALSSSGTVQYQDEAKVRDLTNAGDHITLYAVWTKKYYKVHFDDGVADDSGLQNEIVGTMADQQVEYDKDAHLTKNAYERAGYTFTGWVIEKNPAKHFDDQGYIRNLTDEQYDAKTGKGVVTMVAQWKVNTYTVKFWPGYTAKGSTKSGYNVLDTSKQNVGVGSKLANGELLTKTYQYDKVYRLPECPYYAGKDYAFAGWAREDTALIAKLDSTKAYKQWKAMYGSYLSTNPLAKIYNDQQLVTNLTPIDGDTVNLYAVWVKKDTEPDGFEPTPFVVGVDGYYRLTVQGAQGGGNGGEGGMVQEVVYLKAGQTLYMTKGRQGGYVTSTSNNLSLLTGKLPDGTFAGYNGGGQPTSLTANAFQGTTLYEGLTGGGASHISFTKTTIDKTAKSDLLIAAGGGAATYGTVRGGVGGNYNGEDGK